MSKIIIANWKMNPRSRREAEDLARGSDVEGLIICPPFVFLDDASRMISRAKLGAQDAFWEEVGPYTGEVSAEELKDLGVEYVIVGHSERRQHLSETDEMVAKKIAAAMRAGLTPILCVGETLVERESGKTKEVVGRELEIGLSLVQGYRIQDTGYRGLGEMIIAYEPVWAIGTGIPDSPENMLDMVKFIKSRLSGIFKAVIDKPKVKILYGGSVTSKNAEAFLKHPEIDGALVGGASLKPEEIKKIVEIGKKY